MSRQEDLPNVFLLSADSLRYDYFSEAQEKIAELTNGVSYTNAVAPATQTSSSMPVLSTGKFTDEFETWGLPESEEPRPLAEVFQEFGYTSGLWSDNFLFGAEYNYDRGFDGGDFGTPTWKKKLSMALQNGPTQPLFPLIEWTYFNVFKRITGSMGGEENFYRPASQLHDAALKWLSGQDRPTFAWIHYMDSHHPFEPPSEYIEKCELSTSRSRSELSQLTRDVIKSNGDGYSTADIEDVKCAYEAACEYQADETIAFVERIIEQGLYDPDRDIFVFTADHGECLSYQEYGMMGHVPPALWEEIIRVPLVISIPDWSRGVIDAQVSLVELYNTVRTTVESRTATVDNQDSPTPGQLITDMAHFVTEWEVPGEDTATTYRGVRTDEGTKLFGTHTKREDKIVLAQYDTKTLVDEVQFESDGSSTPTDSETISIWSELINAIEERGPVLNDGQTMRGQLDEEHLRDLGYIQ